MRYDPSRSASSQEATSLLAHGTRPYCHAWTTLPSQHLENRPCHEDGKKVAVQIPAGAELLAIDSVPDPVVDRQQQVQVKWEGKTITMFAVDLREDAEPILTET